MEARAGPIEVRPTRKRGRKEKKKNKEKKKGRKKKKIEKEESLRGSLIFYFSFDFILT